jgi:hypothetical protein
VGGTLAGGTWEALDGATLQLPSPVQTNGASIVLEGMGSIPQLGALVLNTGTLDLSEGADLTTPADFTNTGTLRVRNGAAIGDRSMFISGGSFTNGATGTIVFGVGGESSDDLFGTVDSSTTANLGGNLEVEVLNGYTPLANAVYPVMSYVTRTGSFDSYVGLGSLRVGVTDTALSLLGSDSGLGTAAPGGTVGTDQAVSPTNPLATSVTTPSGGVISITEEDGGPPIPPPGYEVLGTSFASISAPAESAANPLIIHFVIDASVWDGTPLGDLAVLRDGVLVPDCVVPGTSGAAAPDPCIGQRAGVPGSPADIWVRTSQASDWVVVRALDSDGDGVGNSADLCPGTDLASDAAPEGLKKNRLWSTTSGAFVFGDGSDSGVTVTDSGGCSASQIIEAAGLGAGHTRFGISKSALASFIIEATSS